MESSARLHQEVWVLGAGQVGGTFMIKWTFIKDIPNAQFRHILLSNNDGGSRHRRARHAGLFARAGERNGPARRRLPGPPLKPPRLALRFPQASRCCGYSFRSRTSILDDFGFYDKRQELMEARCSSPRRGSRRRRRRRRCRTRCSRSKLCSRTRCSPARISRRSRRRRRPTRRRTRSSRRRRPTTGSLRRRFCSRVVLRCSQEAPRCSRAAPRPPPRAAAGGQRRG